MMASGARTLMQYWFIVSIWLGITIRQAEDLPRSFLVVSTFHNLRILLVEEADDWVHPSPLEPEPPLSSVS